MMYPNNISKNKYRKFRLPLICFLSLALLFIITFSVFASSKPVFGNIDGGDQINVNDVVLVMRHVLNLDSLTINQKELADVNGDGVINVIDVVLIMRKSLDLIDSFPVEDVLDEDAYIIVSLYHDQVDGYNWPKDEELTIKVGTLEEKIVTEDDGSFEFRHNDLDIKPGQTVVVSSGDIRKVHIIRDITITGINPEDNTISGTVEAGSTVEVRVFLDTDEHESKEFPARFPVSNNLSRWTANFDVSTGDDAYQADYNIEIGARGDVRFVDLTNDETVVFWECQEATFAVARDDNNIYGGGWAPVSEITVTIGDNEYTTISAPIDGYFGIEDISVKAGDIVVVTDGVTTGEHLVTDLEIKSANSVIKIVIGSAAPDSDVEVSLLEPAASYGPPETHEVRTVTTNDVGIWSVTFTVDEITENMNVRAVQYDEDNNSTVVSSKFDN